MSRLYGGVDGGGTKTLAIVVDEQGREVGRCRVGESNCNMVGYPEAASRIAEALHTASGGALPLAGACIGAAGVDNPADLAGLREALLVFGLTNRAEKLWLGNDAEIILMALESGVGLGLISGTGAIAFGRDPGGNAARASGWGWLIGDEGSGADIGRQALQAAVRGLDGRGPATSLLPPLLATLKLSSPTQLIGLLYTPGQFPPTASLASLAPVVIKEARAGDKVALDILKRSALNLASSVEAVYNALEFKGSAPGLAMSGGLLINEPLLHRKITARLRRKIGLGQVSLVPEPAVPAALYALKRFGAKS